MTACEDVVLHQANLPVPQDKSGSLKVEKLPVQTARPAQDAGEDPTGARRRRCNDIAGRMARAFEDHDVANELLEAMHETEGEAMELARRKQVDGCNPRARAAVITFMRLLGPLLSDELRVRALQLLDVTGRLANMVDIEKILTAAAAAVLLSSKVDPDAKSPSLYELRNLCNVASHLCATAGASPLQGASVAEEEANLFKEVCLNGIMSAPSAMDWIAIFNGRFNAILLQGRKTVGEQSLARVRSCSACLAMEMMSRTRTSPANPPYRVALGCFALALAAEGLFACAMLCPESSSFVSDAAREEWLRSAECVLSMLRASETFRKMDYQSDLDQASMSKLERVFYAAILMAADCDAIVLACATDKAVETLREHLSAAI